MRPTVACVLREYIFNTMSADQPQTCIDDHSLQGITRKETRLEIVQRHFPYWILPLISATVWFGRYSFFFEEYLQVESALISPLCSNVMGNDDFLVGPRSANIHVDE